MDERSVFFMSANLTLRPSYFYNFILANFVAIKLKKLKIFSFFHRVFIFGCLIFFINLRN